MIQHLYRIKILMAIFSIDFLTRWMFIEFLESLDDIDAVHHNMKMD